MAANILAIDAYRPQISAVFHFTISILVFPEVQEEFNETFQVLYILAIAQFVLTIFYSHTSFYSESSPCWDRMGWWVISMAILIVRIPIPIYSALQAYTTLESTWDQSNAYSLLFLSHAVSCVISTVGYLCIAKKVTCDTFKYYKKRRQMRTQVQNEGGCMSGIDTDKTPFMSYSTGTGEGKRKLGTVMVLKEDLYAVLYCSLIKVEYRER